jgi:hypothetical protein
MVPAPSTFFPIIPSQPTIVRLIIVKSKQKNCKQESDQQHGLRSCHLLVFYGVGAIYFAVKTKVLKDDCEYFENFPPSHIYSSKSGQKQQ